MHETKVSQSTDMNANYIDGITLIFLSETYTQA